MKYIGTLQIVVLFLFALKASANLTTIEQHTIELSTKLTEATVIYSYIDHGTGFYIKENVILTNHHVSKGRRVVLFDSCPATLIYTLDSYDLSLYKSDCRGKPLTFAEHSKSGQTVLVMGNTNGHGKMLSKGIVSGHKGHNIYFDANIAAGNSGGALVNAEGEVLGVVTWKMPNTNVGIAIGVERVQQFIKIAEQYGNWH